jgi:hypothetical protein
MPLDIRELYLVHVRVGNGLTSYDVGCGTFRIHLCRPANQLESYAYNRRLLEQRHVTGNHLDLDKPLAIA